MSDEQDGIAGLPPPPPDTTGMPAAPGEAAPPWAQPGAAPQRNRGKAIAALVCGILGILCFQPVGIAALILGWLGYKEAKSYEPPDGAGVGMSIAGIVTGALAVLLMIVLIALIAFGSGLDWGAY